MDTVQKLVPESDLKGRMQRIEDNLQMMHTYFDALLGKDRGPPKYPVQIDSDQGMIPLRSAI